MLCWCCFREMIQDVCRLFCKKKSDRHTWESATEVKEIRLQDCGKTPKGLHASSLQKAIYLKIPKPLDSQFLLAWSRSTTKIHSKILKINRYHRGFCFAKYYHPVYWGSKLKIRKPFDFTLVTSTSYVKSRLCEKVQQVSTLLCVWVNLVGLFGF